MMSSKPNDLSKAPLQIPSHWGFGGRSKKQTFGHVTFEMFIRHLSRNVGWQLDICLVINGEV